VNGRKDDECRYLFPVKIAEPLGEGGTQRLDFLSISKVINFVNGAHCLKLNLTIESIVASRRMLPYARDNKTGEGAYDESTKQARVIRRDSSTLSEGEEIREEDHAG
jgi:hypothetical protein